MDTMQNYSQTSWGRILLMLRIDLYTFGRGLLMVLGICVLTINVVTRMGGLFGFGFEVTLLSPFDVYSRFSMMSPIVAIYYLSYIHKRIQQSKPTSFTLIPANLWEKIVSIIIGSVAINISFFLMTYLTVFIDWLFAPEIVNLGFHFDSATFSSLAQISWDSPESRLAFDFLGLSSTLIICTQLIRHKSFIKALLLGVVYNTLLWFILGKLIYHIGKYLLSLQGNVEQSIEILLDYPDASFTNVSYGAMTLFLVIDLVLAYYIYYRLKKLEI